ncbi:beta strand repeat-containing protein, partial [Patescibacteria group bacterium]
MFNYRNNKTVKTLLSIFLLIIASGLIFATQARAQTGKTLDISAYILDRNNDPVDDKIHSIRFAIYENKTGGESVWSEKRDVRVVNGFLNVRLGESNPVPESISFSGKEYYLGIKIGDDSEATPRRSITGYVPLALDSDKLQGYEVGTDEDNIPILNEKGEIDNDLLPIGSKEDRLIVLNEDNLIDEKYLPTGSGDDDFVQGDDDRLHDQNTDTGTKSLTFNLGKNKRINSRNFDLTVSKNAAKPALRYSGSTSTWQYSNDGTNFSDIGSASGSYLETTGGTMTGNITFNATQTFGGSSLTQLGYLRNTTLVAGSLLYGASTSALTTLSGAAGDDTQYLRFNWNGGVPTLSWEAVSGGGSFSDFTLSSDSGSDQTISDSNTLELAGGTNISTVASATDTVTINLDSTISGTTWNGTAIGVAYGGTGLSSYTIGDIVYASGSTTLSKLAGVATGNVLISGGVGTAPSWGKVGLTTHVSGTLGAANGGTGADTSSSTGVPSISSGTWSVSATLSDSLVANNLTIAGGTIGTSSIALVNSISPTPTIEGAIEWDSDDDRIVMGDGSGQTIFYSGQGAGGSFTLSADSGSDQAISDSNTLELAGGTNISTVASATDTVTINLDSTISGTTWNGTAIGVAYGGTGLSSYTIGDIVYASGSTTLSKLAGVATGNVLISGGVGTAPSWGKVGLTTHVSGTLGAANGGTGTSTQFTTGSIVFAGASGVYTQDNSNLFWDDSSNFLGIGVASPTSKLHLPLENDAATPTLSFGDGDTGFYETSDDVMNFS